MDGIVVADVEPDQPVAGAVRRGQPVSQLGDHAPVVQQARAHVLARLARHPHQGQAAIGGQCLQQLGGQHGAAQQQRDAHRLAKACAVGIGDGVGPAGQQRQSGQQQRVGVRPAGGLRGRGPDHRHEDGKQHQARIVTLTQPMQHIGQCRNAQHHQHGEDAEARTGCIGRNFFLIGRQPRRAQQGQQCGTDQQHAQHIGQPGRQQQLGNTVLMQWGNLEGVDEAAEEQGVDRGRDQQAHGQEAADRVQPVLGRLPVRQTAQQADRLPGAQHRGGAQNECVARVLRGGQRPQACSGGSHRQPAQSVVPGKGKADGRAGPDQQLPGRTGRDELRHGTQQQGQAGRVQTTHGQRQMLELGETLHTGQPSARRAFMRICRENTRRLAISHGISCRRRRLRDARVGLAQHRAGWVQRCPADSGRSPPSSMFSTPMPGMVRSAGFWLSGQGPSQRASVYSLSSRRLLASGGE